MCCFDLDIAFGSLHISIRCFLFCFTVELQRGSKTIALHICRVLFHNLFPLLHSRVRSRAGFGPVRNTVVGLAASQTKVGEIT